MSPSISNPPASRSAHKAPLALDCKIRPARVLLFVLTLLVLAACQSAPAPDFSESAGPAQPISRGSFTQPWCVDDYLTQEQWDGEFAAMQSVGMDLWIYQWTADSKSKTTIYPTQLPGYHQSSAYDQVEAALKTAQKYGFKVYLGLAFNDDWWAQEGRSRDWMEQEAAAMNQVASELYQQYYSRYPNTFAGWYINWEMDNFAGYNTWPWQKQTMIDALNQVTAHLDQLNPQLPAAIAPFFNTSGGASARQWQRFWYDIASQTGLEIIMFQDGVGVEHADVEDLPVWFDALCRGVHAAGKQCWADLENFTGADSSHAPAPNERLIAQHQALAPHVDRIVTFSFITAMSPEWGNDPSVLQRYQTYVTSQP